MIFQALVGLLVGLAIAIPTDAFGRWKGWPFMTRLLLSWAVCALVAAVWYVVAVS